jgi:hypothetical protein
MNIVIGYGMNYLRIKDGEVLMLKVQFIIKLFKIKNMNKLVFKVNEKACVAFLKKYPLVCNLMENSDGKDLMSAYKKFLKLKDMNESKLGGRAECIGSVSFGTKTFYKYDWDACSGWAELFEYYKNKK